MGTCFNVPPALPGVCHRITVCACQLTFVLATHDITFSLSPHLQTRFSVPSAMKRAFTWRSQTNPNKHHRPWLFSDHDSCTALYLYLVLIEHTESIVTCPFSSFFTLFFICSDLSQNSYISSNHNSCMALCLYLLLTEYTESTVRVMHLFLLQFLFPVPAVSKQFLCEIM